MQNLLVRSKSAIIQPSGALCAANSEKFQDQINTAVLSEENDSLLVDLGMVDFIDSKGLMVLLSAHKEAVKLGKRFSLFGVSKPARMVLELTQLDQVFEILDAAVYPELMAA